MSELEDLIEEQRMHDNNVQYPEAGVVVASLDAWPQGEVPQTGKHVSKPGGCIIHGYSSLYIPPGWTNWTHCRVCENDREKLKRAVDFKYAEHRRELERKSQARQQLKMTEEQRQRRRERSKIYNRERRRTLTEEDRERRRVYDREVYANKKAERVSNGES